MRALVIDDANARRRHLARVLEGRGHAVACVSSPDSGLSLHEDAPFDLIAVGPGAPGGDVPEVCRRVRALPGGGEVTVLAVTDRGSPEDAAEALAGGATDCIQAPFEDEQLRLRLLVAEFQACRRSEEHLRPLAVGVAHELNNPLAYVLSNVRLLREELQSVGAIASQPIEHLCELVDESIHGVERIRAFVRNLKLLPCAMEGPHGGATPGGVALEHGLQQGMRLGALLPAAEAPSAPPSEPPQAEQEPKRLLIVDDEPLVGRSLKRVLREHHVTVVSSGLEAVETLTSNGAWYDLVLCDVMMPGMSGIDVFDAVTGQRPELAGRFVFMTGGAFAEGTRASLERLGAEPIEKPIDPHHVRALVRARVPVWSEGSPPE